MFENDLHVVFVSETSLGNCDYIHKLIWIKNNSNCYNFLSFLLSMSFLNYRGTIIQMATKYYIPSLRLILFAFDLSFQQDGES